MIRERDRIALRRVISCYQVDITGILDRISGVDIKFGGNELMPVKELSAT